MVVRIACTCLLAGLFAANTSLAADNWPAWRGLNQDGTHAGDDLPLRWSETNIVWRTALPGIGQSTPCLWGDRIFLTAALGNGAERVVFCVDKNSGEILWQHTVWKGAPEESHALNGWASASCTTDGELVFAFFGRGGLHCYTVDGEPVWSRNLGPFAGPWGTAASPVLVRGLLIQNCDADADARLTAFDKQTGKDVWSVPREQTRGWSTPVLLQVGQREELVLNGHSAVRAYDPETGAELWSCRSFAGRGEPMATYANGLIHLICGLKGDTYAVRPGGNGDVTATHMAWHATRPGGRDLPSPLVVGPYLYEVNMDGILACYEAATGKEHFRARMGGKHVGSPVSYRDRAIFTDETGVTRVVKPGNELSVEFTNSLGDRGDELFRSSPVPNEKHLYLRSSTHLYKIGE